MAIREDLVASAANFLQDPSVSASTPESRVAFLKSKNLTPEEISAALARAGFDGGNGTAGPAAYAVATQHPQGAQVASQQPSPYGHSNPYGPPPNFPPYGWQPSPPPPPRRDWRDWFIMATVVGGVGYGLFSMTKRYIYPLVAPPTPDRLAQDKEAIDAQFARAFALVEQLAQDTEALKTAEQARTERLDQALANLEAVLTDLQTASKRREDDAARLRDDVRGLKDALPRALDTQREVTDGRLREVNTELKGLKTLLGQRLAASSSSGGGGGSGNAVTNGGSVSGSPAATSTPLSYLRASGGSGGGVGGPATSSTASAPPVVSIENESTEHAGPAAVASPTTNNGAVTPAAPGVPTSYSPAGSSNGTASPTLNTLGKAAIPAWQRAMLKPSSTASSPAPTASNTNGASSSSSSSVQPEASGTA